MTNNERIEDLLIEFDELDMQPMLIVPDPIGRAKEWKRELTYAIKHLKSEVAREIFAEIDSYVEKKMSKYNRLINDTIEPTAVQIYGTTNATLMDTKSYIAELKKKYIGDKRCCSVTKRN